MRYTYGIFWTNPSTNRPTWWLCKSQRLATRVARDRQAIVGRITRTSRGEVWDAPTFKALMDVVVDHRVKLAQ